MRQFLSGASGPSFKAVKRMQDKTAGLANMKTPVDTGALKRAQVKSPVVVTGDRVIAGVEYRSPYALFVHEGTRAHIIRPRNKKVLAWTTRGSSEASYARQVRHPGTKPQRWLQTALFFAAKSEGFRASNE